MQSVQGIAHSINCFFQIPFSYSLNRFRETLCSFSYEILESLISSKSDKSMHDVNKSKRGHDLPIYQYLVEVHSIVIISTLAGGC